jgi:hypothetical protein
MKINQIQQTRVIKYPKWEEVILDQKLLKNNIPKIWK